MAQLAPPFGKTAAFSARVIIMVRLLELGDRHGGGSCRRKEADCASVVYESRNSGNVIPCAMSTQVYQKHAILSIRSTAECATQERMAAPSHERINKLLARGIAEVIDRRHLGDVLGTTRRIRIKFGIDPTGDRLHLGHAVALRILRRFQDLGHTVVLVIGDFTAGIGDPSGKNETRPPLSSTEIKKNYTTYERQAFLILDEKKTEVRWQTEWFGKMKLKDVIAEASKLSAGWIYSHDTFRNRLKSGQPLALHETMYPLLQAYDSVEVKADVEIGGLDQKFNLLTGRELMKAHSMVPQDVVLAKYLMGTDGQKMGKTLNNFIALEEEPSEMFGKIMSMPDTALRDYFELATDVPMDEINAMTFSDVAARDAKLKLAETIVGMYHGADEAELTRNGWRQQVSETGANPEHVPFYIDHRKKPFLGNEKKNLLEVLVAVGIAKSKSDARRLFEQGAVTIDGRVERNWGQKAGDLPANTRLIVGKKKIVVPIERLS